jgi:hypothetical protein
LRSAFGYKSNLFRSRCHTFFLKAHLYLNIIVCRFIYTLAFSTTFIMKTFAVAPLVGLATAGMIYPRANSTNVPWTTEVVTSFTTYCPGPTEVVVNDKTHTVTEATTLTITDCPCTISRPVTSLPPKPTATKTKGHNDDHDDDDHDVVYTTKVVDVYTTYCPGPTTVVVGDQTHTVTEATTLTVTDCPCTVTEPVKPTDKPEHPKPTDKGDHDDDDNDDHKDDDDKDIVYTTKVTTAYTTYCPGPTTVVVGDQTHTVTEATTLTISDGCPCTVTEPVKPTDKPVVPVKPTDKPVIPVKPTDKPVKPTDKPVIPVVPGDDNDNDNDDDKPDQTGPVVVQPTGTNPPPEQVTGAAAGVKPVGALAALAVIALL